MLVMLIWLAGAAAMAYEITKHGMWRDGLAACAFFAFLFWVVGGAAGISMRSRLGRPAKHKGEPNVNTRTSA
jgi:hypothetical protein